MSTDHTEQCATEPAVLRAVTAAAAEIVTAPPRQQAANAYLRQRGIDPTQLGDRWIIGYAPPGWTRLIDTLRGQFDDQALLDAGLARRCRRGTLIDTFRDRVLFGVHDGPGNLAGFVARDLSGDAHAPKYLNTQRHPLFAKSALLFGLHESSSATHPVQPVIVEGPLDVLAVASRVGGDGAALLPVAPCGTAFTPAHARQVADVAYRHQAPVVVAMDADAPGRAAALNVGEQLRKLGLDVRVAHLPNGTDPADYLGRTEATLAPFHADQGLPLLTVHVQRTIASVGEDMQWIEGRLSALRRISAYLATYPERYAAEQILWLAEVLDLQRPTVVRELAGAFHVRGRWGGSAPDRCDRSPSLI